MVIFIKVLLCVAFTGFGIRLLYVHIVPETKRLKFFTDRPEEDKWWLKEPEEKKDIGYYLFIIYTVIATIAADVIVIVAK